MPPLYSYECVDPKCYGRQQELRPVEERHRAPQCYCGKAMQLRIEPVKGFVKNPAVPKAAK